MKKDLSSEGRRPKGEDRQQTAPLCGTDRPPLRGSQTEASTRPGEAYADTVITGYVGFNNKRTMYLKNAIVDVLNDALDHQYFFVKDIEVDYRYVMTSSVKDLMDLIAAGDLRRSEVAS